MGERGTVRYPSSVRKAGCRPDTGTCAPSRLPGRPRGLVATAFRLTTDIGWGIGYLHISYRRAGIRFPAARESVGHQLPLTW